ncbi:putative membrane protein YgcG [Spinactinospora alkalitolerans]|uniref:Putative membrane protein YgcG n=1 Tax=Spinactinospora alkalitolerans TaxID=687207 RepID=A0A852TPG0_9ACTN|nr:hypothetical protein [Spinactinospora alkalitolerans]NYE46246.1 putative membrane protein YgcG [Spinactinospora alkalitolerans]
MPFDASSTPAKRRWPTAVGAVACAAVFGLLLVGCGGSRHCGDYDRVGDDYVYDRNDGSYALVDGDYVYDRGNGDYDRVGDDYVYDRGGDYRLVNGEFDRVGCRSGSRGSSGYSGSSGRSDNERYSGGGSSNRGGGPGWGK